MATNTHLKAIELKAFRLTPNGYAATRSAGI